jgi:hypothetical protein
MKTTGLLFLTMVWAALAPGTGYAVPSTPASQPTSSGSSANPGSGHPGDAGHAASPRDGRYQRGGKASDINHPPRRANLTKRNLRKPPPNGRQGFLSGNAMHPPGSNQSVSAVKGGFIPNETLHNTLPGRAPSAVRLTGLLPDNLSRRRSPVVSVRTPCPHCASTGEINGTRVNLKR